MDSVELPDSVQGYLGYMRVRITEEIAWMQGSPLFNVMAEGGGGTFRPGDTTLLQVLCQNSTSLHSFHQSAWILRSTRAQERFSRNLNIRSCC